MLVRPLQARRVGEAQPEQRPLARALAWAASVARGYSGRGSANPTTTKKQDQPVSSFLVLYAFDAPDGRAIVIMFFVWPWPPGAFRIVSRAARASVSVYGCAGTLRRASPPEGAERPIWRGPAARRPERRRRRKQRGAGRGPRTDEGRQQPADAWLLLAPPPQGVFCARAPPPVPSLR